MTDRRTTSTFIIHHGQCDPSKWTAADILKLAHYVQWGDLASAAALSRLGVQLVMDERHEPKGGTLERIGVAFPGDLNEFSESVSDLDPGEDVFEVVPIYRGPTEHVVRFGVDDGCGEFGGYEYEVLQTAAEADAFHASIEKEADRASLDTKEGGGE